MDAWLLQVCGLGFLPGPGRGSPGFGAGTPNLKEGGGNISKGCPAPVDEANDVSDGWLRWPRRRDVGDLGRDMIADGVCERARGDIALETPALVPIAACEADRVTRGGDDARETPCEAKAAGPTPWKDMDPGRKCAAESVRERPRSGDGLRLVVKD